MDSTSSPTFATRAVLAVTHKAAAHPFRVLLLTFVALAALWTYASGLRVTGSFVELLPSESPTAKRFHETLARKAGATATLVVMVESPDAEQNRRFVDALARKLHGLPPGLASSIDVGPGPARDFFTKWRWLFADRGDLVVAECELERDILEREGAFLGLDDPCEEREGADDRPSAEPAPPAAAAPRGSGSAAAPTPAPAPLKGGNSALRRFESELKARVDKLDRYPTGYYRNSEGTLYSIMVRALGSGMGELAEDALLDHTKRFVAELAPSSYPGLTVGYAGSIPNAIAEREALVSDMAIISVVAVVLILGSIVFFFRSALALVHLALPVAVGAGVAFSIAMARYGTLNSATSFLGSIIAGNGINYGIVYLARYREQRRELKLVEALADAAATCKDATWLAALATAGAYGALTVTSFRGFSQFGLIGAAGMIACWISTFVLIPASVAAWERILRRDEHATVGSPHPVIASFIANLTTRRAVPLLCAAAAVTAVVAWPVPRYLSDPWEYDFSKLGSGKSRAAGAGAWSTKSNRVFETRGAPMMLLADDMSHVLRMKAELLARDRELGGDVIERIETVYERLGGTPDLVAQKLELLALIRKHIDRGLPRLKGEDRRIAEEWRPPEYLRPLTEADLPPLVREQFVEKDGRFGTPIYVYLNRRLSQSNGHNLLRISDVLESARRGNGDPAPNTSRSAVFAAMIRSMERDGPLATALAFGAVLAIVVAMTRRVIPAAAVIGSLLIGVAWTVGIAAWTDLRLNFLNFVALPITFGIGVDYAINIYDRVRVEGDVRAGFESVGGSMFLCSLATVFGYGALLFADNRALVSFGRYAITGEIACSVSASLLLPAVLWLGAKRRERRTSQVPPQSS